MGEKINIDQNFCKCDKPELPVFDEIMSDYIACCKSCGGILTLQQIEKCVTLKKSEENQQPKFLSEKVIQIAKGFLGKTPTEMDVFNWTDMEELLEIQINEAFHEDENKTQKLPVKTNSGNSLKVVEVASKDGKELEDAYFDITLIIDMENIPLIVDNTKRDANDFIDNKTLIVEKLKLRP